MLHHAAFDIRGLLYNKCHYYQNRGLGVSSIHSEGRLSEPEFMLQTYLLWTESLKESSWKLGGKL